MKLGRKVRTLRQKKNWRQRDLSNESGISQAALSRIENGRVTKVQPTTLRRLAGVFGIPVDFLTQDDDPSNDLLEACMLCYARHFLGYPIEEDELLLKLRNAIVSEIGIEKFLQWLGDAKRQVTL